MITNLSLVPQCCGCTRSGGKSYSSDSFLVGDLTRRLTINATNLDTDGDISGNQVAKLLVVARGHGSPAGRYRAASLAIESVCDHLLNAMHRFVKLADERDKEIRDELAVSLERCQRRLALEQQSRPELADVGASMTLAYVAWPRMYVVHVGNTRCYLVRERRLRQLTTDHTVAQQFVNGGAMTRHDLDTSGWRHALWNCVGGNDANIAPEILKIDLRSDDLLLLCASGVSSRLGHRDLERLLTSEVLSRATPEMVTERVIDAASESEDFAPPVPYDDDLTVVTARF